MKSLSIKRAYFAQLALLVSCTTAPEEAGVSIQLQYRVQSTYAVGSKTPVQSAIARANIYTRTKYRPKVAPAVSFTLNGQTLEEYGEGAHMLNDVSIVQSPYILTWTVTGYSDSVYVVNDTILPSLAVEQFESGDTVKKTKGISIPYMNGITTSGASKHIYCLIMKDNYNGVRDFSEGTRTMFDQIDNGTITITPEILSALQPGIRYVLSVERGDSKPISQKNVNMVSSTFSELTLYFYLSE